MVASGAPIAAPRGAVEPFELDDWAGEIASAHRPGDLAAEVRRVADPASSTRTLHWGRNYLYVASWQAAAGPLDVVVKQFRNEGLGRRLKRRVVGSKAAKSWRAAHAVVATGVRTPEPVALVESRRPDGPSLYLCRYEPEGFEARYFFRALTAGRAAEEFPQVAPEALLTAIAALVARLHAAGIWHRDVSVGNLLVVPGATPATPPALSLLDLNRCRLRARLTVSQRTRDLCRLPLFAPALVELFLRAYWGEAAAGFAGKRALYRLYAGAFRFRHRAKPALRGALGTLRALLWKRGTHAHIPPPPAAAAMRDRIVWDPLSDQPHQHAGRVARALVRLRDAPVHAAGLAAAARVWPRARRRSRELLARAFAPPATFAGLGVALRPWPENRPALLAALGAAGARRVLLRLHPWQREHGEEERLAAELASHGYELAFALPQNRELVRDPARWRAAVEELAARFAPYGRHFQIGQAINRSKWGVWNPREYLALAATAAEILRRTPGVEVLGPAVIDFEPYALAAVLEMGGPAFAFDAVSALLYVDRRGAPENPQLGYDTLGKLALYRGLAETTRRGAPRLWVTEVNWPLAEGPHSPAGRAVAVDEATQADYLARYFLLALGSGLAERVYWWQLVARGYGLLAPQPDGTLRRRPAFHALAALAHHLEGARSEGLLPSAAGTRLLRFRLADGGPAIVGWSLGAPAEVELPAPVAERIDLASGEERTVMAGGRIAVGRSPSLLRLAE